MTGILAVILFFLLARAAVYIFLARRWRNQK